jgi:hypothetical protein
MTIKLRKKEKNYAQVHRNMLFNDKLSLKAKGLGSLLEIYSDDFNISEKTIINRNTDGKRSLKTAIFELEQCDYLLRLQTHHTENGQFVTIWIFDSEIVDIDYIKQIIDGLNNISILTTVGTLCTIGTKCGDGSTASGECTPYKNKNIKEEENINIKRLEFSDIDSKIDRDMIIKLKSCKTREQKISIDSKIDEFIDHCVDKQKRYKDYNLSFERYMEVARQRGWNF